MQIIKEQLNIDDELEKRIKNILKFLNIKSKIIKGNIIHIPKTNITYIEPHKLEINEITYTVIEQTKKVMEMQPKIQKVYNEVDEYAKSYKYLEKENENIQKKVKYLRIKNQKLEQENNNLVSYIRVILRAIKHFFRELLQIDNDKVKEATTNEIKDYYDNEDFNKNDVYDIAKDTDKEDGLIMLIWINITLKMVTIHGFFHRTPKGVKINYFFHFLFP